MLWRPYQSCVDGAKRTDDVTCLPNFFMLFLKMWLYIYKHNKFSVYLKMFWCCKNNYYISQLVCTLRLVKLVGSTKMYVALNSKFCFSRHAKCQRYYILLTSLSCSVLLVTDPRFSCSGLEIWAEKKLKSLNKWIFEI